MSINIGKSQGSTNVSHLVPLVGRCKTKVLEDVLFPNIHKADSENIREFLWALCVCVCVCVCVISYTWKNWRGPNWMGAVDFLIFHVFLGVHKFQVSSLGVANTTELGTHFLPLDPLQMCYLLWLLRFPRLLPGEKWGDNSEGTLNHHQIRNYWTIIVVTYCHGKFNISMLYNYFILKIQSLKK
jgi:hypothetical protein